MKTVFIGAGKGCLAVLDMFEHGDLSALDLEILAVVDVDRDAPAMRFARDRGWQTLASIERALALPGLEFVVELTGSDEVLEQIYHHLPAAVRVMDHATAGVFWDLEEATKTLRAQLRERTEIEAKLAADRVELREILDTIPDVVMVVEREGRVWRVNRRFEEITGLSRAEAVGRICRDVVARAGVGTGCRSFPQLFAEVMENHSAVTRVRRQVAAGKELYFQVAAAPTFDGKGCINRVVLTSREITQQVRLKRELARSERLMAVGKLAAGVAHELNNPLTGILTFAEDLFNEARPDDPRRSDYEVILGETLRCRRIVRDLLDFSRRKTPERRRMDLGQVVRRSLAMIERQVTFQDVSIREKLGLGLPEVDIDPGQLTQAILNLVINARDAVNGRGVIEIRTETCPDGRSVAVAIADNGCGIPQEQLKEIFEPFYSTKGDQGNGLGLPAVQAVVEQHGGHVEVESTIGAGSEFRLVLPVARDEEGAADGGQARRAT